MSDLKREKLGMGSYELGSDLWLSLQIRKSSIPRVCRFCWFRSEMKLLINFWQAINWPYFRAIH